MAADPVATPTASSSEAAPKRRRRFLVGTLFTLAVVIGVFSVLAVWANRQVLNTDNVTNTSSQILADKEVQTALSAYLVNELFRSVNVENELKSSLPPQLQGVAGPAAGALKQAANQAVPRLLATQQAQNAFKQAVHAAHSTFLKVINGGKYVSTHGGAVTLNLNTLVSDLGASLGVSSQVSAAQKQLQNGGAAKAQQTAQQKLGITVPANAGQLTILRSGQLKTAQDIVNVMKSLAIALPLIALALFALAVWFAEGRRRRALRTTGWCWIGIGVLVLLVRRVAGNALVDNLVKIDSNKPAIHNIWTIGTTLLYDIAAALVVFGIIFVLAAWLAGQTRPATAVRRALAPTLREHPVRCYLAVAGVYLLLILWGPTPAFRQLVSLLIIAALLVLGVELLRRQTAREFPDAQAGDAMRSLRAWYAGRRAGPAPVAAAGNGEHVDAIERLAALHARGDLSDSEFAAEKSVLINGS